MMISSEMYAEDHKTDTFEELIEIRDNLVDELKTLEKIIFDKEQKDKEWDICPGPDVQYQMTLEYLSKLCIVLHEKYNNEVIYADD